MATLMGSPSTSSAERCSSKAQFRQLPFQLDLTCPIGLGTKNVAECVWPFSVAGPSGPPEEPLTDFVRRRCLETVFLGEMISPMSGLIADLTSIEAPDNPSAVLSDLIKPHILSLIEIERRYRKTLPPVITALASLATSEAVRRESVLDAVQAAGLSREEADSLHAAVGLRLGSRAMAERDGVLNTKKLAEEFERRETLVQIILLFQWIYHNPAPPPKKRKRSHRRDEAVPTAASATKDPMTALELLMDRLSVWQAVTELGLDTISGAGGGGKGKGKDEEDSVDKMLRRFWENVILPFSVAKQPHLCASFHLKVFGTPIPSKLLPASALPKKPRKPKITHPRPSNDDLVPPPLSKPRALSRAPSEVSSRASPPRQHSIGMRRSLSKTSDSHPHDQFRRSRSRSIDLSGAKDQALLADLLPPPAAKRSIVRAPSGKDLFKGRDVGFLRRTASFVARKHSESQSQCQGVRGGLLGRKTSDPVNSGNVRPESQAKTEFKSKSAVNTIIFATPSKPRLANVIFGPRATAFHHPTPIREELSSVERQSWIAETPVAPSRIAETPIAKGRTSVIHLSSLNSVDKNDEDGDADPLAELMVMTDEEDGDEKQGSRGAVIPETPTR